MDESRMGKNKEQREHAGEKRKTCLFHGSHEMEVAWSRFLLPLHEVAVRCEPHLDVDVFGFLDHASNLHHVAVHAQRAGAYLAFQAANVRNQIAFQHYFLSSSRHALHTRLPGDDLPCTNADNKTFKKAREVQQSGRPAAHLVRERRAPSVFAQREKRHGDPDSQQFNDLVPPGPQHLELHDKLGIVFAPTAHGMTRVRPDAKKSEQRKAARTNEVQCSEAVCASGLRRVGG